MYPTDSAGLAIVPPEALTSLPAGIVGVDEPVRQGNVVSQTVLAKGRRAHRTLNLLTGDNVLHYHD